MDNKGELSAAIFSGLLIGVMLGLVLVIFVGIRIANADWRRVTIARGLAQYCPESGAWAWTGECGQ